jgi:type VI protein secretion system component VasK
MGRCAMNWIALIIFLAAVWLAVYVLTSLMAERRRRMLDQWQRQHDGEASQASQAEAPTATPQVEDVAEADPTTPSPGPPAS